MTKEQAQELLDIISERQNLHERVLEAQDRFRTVDRRLVDFVNSLIVKEPKA